MSRFWILSSIDALCMKERRQIAYVIEREHQNWVEWKKRESVRSTIILILDGEGLLGWSLVFGNGDVLEKRMKWLDTIMVKIVQVTYVVKNKIWQGKLPSPKWIWKYLMMKGKKLKGSFGVDGRGYEVRSE
ncbi:unnamed protein product [Dovyalis caffra]|uniref:Uncharacterized protein n=1 Tax=Dovyalis caffra TaxID=77055 RepID=A0AAV1SK43_9ROSI|nr:unnamed protein product [Dovyalis caffra]